MTIEQARLTVATWAVDDEQRANRGDALALAHAMTAAADSMRRMMDAWPVGAGGVVRVTVTLEPPAGHVS